MAKTESLIGLVGIVVGLIGIAVALASFPDSLRLVANVVSDQGSLKDFKGVSGGVTLYTFCLLLVLAVFCLLAGCFAVLALISTRYGALRPEALSLGIITGIFLISVSVMSLMWNAKVAAFVFSYAMFCMAMGLVIGTSSVAISDLLAMLFFANVVWFFGSLILAFVTPELGYQNHVS